MKYLQNGGFQNNPHMRLTLGLAIALLAGFWLSNAALYFAHMSLDPASVAAYYRDDEARFMAPRSAEGMLEVTHMHLPMFALVLLLLTHLVILAPLRNAARTWIIAGSFGPALLMDAAGWLARNVHRGIAMHKVVAFGSSGSGSGSPPPWRFWYCERLLSPAIFWCAISPASSLSRASTPTSSPLTSPI